MLFRFREFPVYKDARFFRQGLKALSKKKFPKEEQYVLRDQLWRALDSILLNIAEGSDRYSDTDFSRFLNNALTSLNEVVACLDLALDDSYINSSDYDCYFEQSGKIAKQLLRFSSTVRNKNKKS